MLGLLYEFVRRSVTTYRWSLQFTNDYWTLERFHEEVGAHSSPAPHEIGASRVVEVSYWNEVVGESAVPVVMTVQHQRATIDSVLGIYDDPESTQRLVLTNVRPDPDDLAQRLRSISSSEHLYQVLLGIGEVLMESIEYPWFALHTRSGIRVRDLIPPALRQHTEFVLLHEGPPSTR